MNHNIVLFSLIIELLDLEIYGNWGITLIFTKYVISLLLS